MPNEMNIEDVIEVFESIWHSLKDYREHEYDYDADNVMAYLETLKAQQTGRTVEEVRSLVDKINDVYSYIVKEREWNEEKSQVYYIVRNFIKSAPEQKTESFASGV